MARGLSACPGRRRPGGWNIGSIAAGDVAEELGAAIGIPRHRILQHMRACCRRVSLYQDVLALTAKLTAPQAIVTINPDIFSEVVVPHFDLRERFAAIVTSWEEPSLSKADLCDIAMSRLPGAVDRKACLLIDNRADNVAEWRARGGAAWLFEGYGGLAAHLSDRMEAR
jgi:hypothetical protein